VAFIVYLQRKELARLPLRGTIWGIVPMGLALVFFWAGYRVENYYIGFFAIHLLVGGLILWLAGWRWFFSLFFAFAFLTFLWPLYFLENTITFPLRMIMSHASVAVLNLLGIPVILQGTGIISAPDPLVGLAAGKKFSVDVADPCSGIRSLFALMMVSALYAHFTLNTWWKKWMLFLCSIPLAIAGNLVRILTLTLGTVAFGTEFAIGKNALTEPSWFHLGAGYMVFAVALGGMIAIAWLLNGGAAGFAGWMRAFVRLNERPRTSENKESAPATPKHKRQDLY
jgi:exosortase